MSSQIKLVQINSIDFIFINPVKTDQSIDFSSVKSEMISAGQIRSSQFKLSHIRSDQRRLIPLSSVQSGQTRLVQVNSIDFIFISF